MFVLFSINPVKHKKIDLETTLKSDLFMIEGVDIISCNFAKKEVFS